MATDGLGELARAISIIRRASRIACGYLSYKPLAHGTPFSGDASELTAIVKYSSTIESPKAGTKVSSSLDPAESKMLALRTCQTAPATEQFNSGFLSLAAPLPDGRDQAAGCELLSQAAA